MSEPSKRHTRGFSGTLGQGYKEVALQLYTVREEIEANQRETLLRVAALGFDSVEVCDALTNPGALRDDLDSVGLSVTGVHGPLFDGRLETLVAGAQTLGTDLIVSPDIAPECFSDARSIEKVASTLEETCRWINSKGMRFAYHNHHWEAEPDDSGLTTLDLLHELVPNMMFEVDLYWAYVGGCDVVDLLGRLGNQVCSIHLKDGDGTVDGPMTAVGHGSAPISEALGATQPETSWILEQDRSMGDVFEDLKSSLEFVRP